MYNIFLLKNILNSARNQQVTAVTVYSLTIHYNFFHYIERTAHLSRTHFQPINKTRILIYNRRLAGNDDGTNERTLVSTIYSN